MIKVINQESEISNPEIIAMLMAFYSRSTVSINTRLKELGETEEEIKKSLKKYYIGYGHRSIGDCGDASLFFEGVSILAAKALEDNPLFNGQETSSRYVDYSTQMTIDPLGEKHIQDNWISFYTEICGEVKKEITDTYFLQNPSEEMTTTLNNAIAARTFDICRSLIPAGVATQLGLKMSFSSLQDHLWKLEQHPTQEVRSIATEAIEKLIQQYPSSFIKNTNASRIDYYQETSEEEFYLMESPRKIKRRITSPTVNVGGLWLDEIEQNIELLMKRPKGSPMPRFMEKWGTVKINYSLDYGSWRDLQRHRNTLYNKATPLTNLLDFNTDYFESLSYVLKCKILRFITDQYELLFLLKNKYNDNPFELQYYYPLGNYINAELVLSIPELMYIFELRSSKSVHFTLRKLIHSIIENSFSDMENLISRIPNYIDFDESNFYLNRGKETIVMSN